MTDCPERKSDWLDLLLEDREEGRRTSVNQHLKSCPECRGEVEGLLGVLAGADAVKGDIREAMSSVDWEALPGRIADYVYRNAGSGERATLGDRMRLWLSRPALRPVLAGLLLGVALGSFGTYMALRHSAPGAGPAMAAGFHAPKDFLDRAELEMARRETLNYLEKSQYLLLDFVETGSGAGAARPAYGRGLAKELLSKKKYLNPQLEKFRMAKAKAICDQIEMLFLELAQISDELPAAELRNIRNLIQERQLLLKINIVRKELEREV
jgi:hypothetical protein